MSTKRKLIEVALPLEAINRESAREKQPFTRNHPRSIHVWWARRPLVACRAVLFAQLVDDPSAHPDRFPTEDAQAKERSRLFRLIEKLVVWENSTDEALLEQARAEIRASFDGDPPAILDPFAGGGSIPLEAQRLGLEAHAADLNPVAVLINKALIEIPPRWAGQSPVWRGAAEERLGGWPRATGLAEDVRRYGQWMRDQAEQRIGHHYPQATLPDGTRAPVIAWIWARTITCPNPACRAEMPLARSFWLSKKKHRRTWVEPEVEGATVRFRVVSRESGGPDPDGTVGRQGAVCLVCGTPVDLKYIRHQGRDAGLGNQLMAVVAEGYRRRLYVEASDGQSRAAMVAEPSNPPEGDLPEQALGFRVQAYGMTRHRDLFTNRQLVALMTLSELVPEARQRVRSDALSAGLLPADADIYASAVATLLGLAVSRYADLSNSICSWNSTNEAIRALFARQAIPMTWDFAEVAPFGAISVSDTIEAVARSVAHVGMSSGDAEQRDATSLELRRTYVVATDPPYYDNIGYADLSDFFYVWLRRSLRDVYPDLFATILSPKAAELVATPYRFDGDRAAAEQFFEAGFVRTFANLRQGHPEHVPLTLFYAFKQAEKSDEAGIASTGWATMLEGLLRAGWMVTATWPMRTERAERSVSIGASALASSIVLACRKLPVDAPRTDRKGFIAALRRELPEALRHLQEGNVAPVDLAQASIGPGMAVFSRYAKVAEADGSRMRVRMALALINQVLDEVLAEQEGDIDPDSRWCRMWFERHAWNDGPYGEAETLATARNTSVAGLAQAGVLASTAGKVRLLSPDDLPAGYDPSQDRRVTVWEVALHLSKRLDEQGVEAAADLMNQAGRHVDLDAVKELAYLLYSICERQKWAESAIRFNSLVTAWPDISHAARDAARAGASAQGSLDFDDAGGEA